MKNDFKLFVLRNEDINSRKGRGERLIKHAALSYGVPEQMLRVERICRTDMGKPFFENLDIKFSVSHSEALWACLIGPFNCGLDVQYIKPCNYVKIAGRFFSEKEKEYVENTGIDGFFELWVRKEAFGKYTGDGFFGKMPEMVLQDGTAASRLSTDDGRTVIFKEVFLDKNIKCVVCLPAEYDGDVSVEDCRKGF